jgi:tetratricopeptide (TPR) repeat protein
MTLCSPFRWFAFILMFVILPVSYAILPEFRHIVPTRDQNLPLNEIDRLFLDGQYQLAYEQLTTHLGNSETVAAAQLHNYGLLQRELGLGDGLEWLREAYDHEPESFFNAWSLGRALLEEDSLVAAEKYLRVAIKLDDKFNESSIDLANCLRRQGRLDEAENLLQSIVRKHRSDGEAYAELAQVFIDRGGYENIKEAQELLEDASEEFPFEPVLRLKMQTLINRNQTTEAIEVGQQYLRYFPKSPHALETAAVLREMDPGGNYTADGIYHHDAYSEGKPYLDPRTSLSPGKRIHWRARYGLINVGEISAETTEGIYKGQPCWIARYTARSTVPFVAIADTFYAWIDKDLLFTHRLDMVYNESKLTSRKTIETNYDEGAFDLRVWERSGYWWMDRLPLPPSMYDSTTQLWYTQQLVLAGKNGACNITIDHTYEQTSVQNEGPDGELKLMGETFPVVKLSGTMPYSGFAGLTGDFHGWYTDDAHAYPAKAKFKIFLGSITILIDSVTDSDFNQGIMTSRATNWPQSFNILSSSLSNQTDQ